MMMPMTEVFDLRRGEVVATYALPPREAVVAAYQQFEQKNYNTWEYASLPHPSLDEGKFVVACGDFSALKNPRAVSVLR